MPVVIMAGHGDKIVSGRQAERLHAAIPGSSLRVVEGVGHMVHHIASRAVVAAVAEVAREGGTAAPASSMAASMERVAEAG